MSDCKEVDATFGPTVVKTPFALDGIEFNDEPFLFPPEILEDSSFGSYLISFLS